MKNLLLCASLLVITACGQRTDTATQANAAQHSPLSREDRQRIIDSAMKGLSLERDKIEKVSFFSPENENVVSSRLSIYISIPDGAVPLVRITPIYSGSDWIFFDHIKVMADDEIVYERAFDDIDIKRENYGSTIWERADYAAKYLDIQAIRKIARAKKATIRFSGRDRREDHELTELEFKNLRRILSAYDALAKLGN